MQYNLKFVKAFMISCGDSAIIEAIKEKKTVFKVLWKSI